MFHNAHDKMRQSRPGSAHHRVRKNVVKQNRQDRDSTNSIQFWDPAPEFVQRLSVGSGLVVEDLATRIKHLDNFFEQEFSRKQR